MLILSILFPALADCIWAAIHLPLVLISILKAIFLVNAHDHTLPTIPSQSEMGLRMAASIAWWITMDVDDRTEGQTEAVCQGQ